MFEELRDNPRVKAYQHEIDILLDTSLSRGQFAYKWCRHNGLSPEVFGWVLEDLQTYGRCQVAWDNAGGTDKSIFSFVADMNMCPSQLQAAGIYSFPGVPVFGTVAASPPHDWEPGRAMLEAFMNAQITCLIEAGVIVHPGAKS